MPKDSSVQSPLLKLKPREKPDPERLLQDIREGLTRANEQGVWERMEHNHAARYMIWDGHTRSCRKPTKEELGRLMPGKKADDITPWPGAADLEVRLTDEIIGEFTDLLIIAEKRADRNILPAMLDVTAEDRMQKAEGWGGVAEHYREQADYERGNALAQWADIGWEYGHGIVFIGWKDEKHVEPRTLSQDTLLQVVTAAAMARADAQRRQQLEAEGQASDAETVLTPEETAFIMINAMNQVEDLIADDSQREKLIAALIEYDEDMPLSEAKRVAASLKRNAVDVDYYVPVTLRAMPDWRALTPGVDIFYPPETTRIQEAPFVVVPEWFTAVELRAKIDEGWDEDWIEEVLEKSPGRAFNVTDQTTLFGSSSWVLSRGAVGLDLRREIEQPDSGYFQVLTVYYRATAMGGVPATYKTVLHGDVKDKLGYHVCCEHVHGRYPLADYVRERRATCMWDSRGVGECSFSEQEEMRIQINGLADNASLAIAPPIEVPLEAGRTGKQLIAPRVQIPTRRTGGLSGIKKVDLAGDFSGAINVEKSARERSNRYWQRGAGTEIDPIAKSNRQQRLSDDWVCAVKEAERLTFKLIQQFASDRIRTAALNGQAFDLDMSREDIQGEFSLKVEFDVGVLDPKTVENRKDAAAVCERDGSRGPVADGTAVEADGDDDQSDVGAVAREARRES